MVGSGGGYIKLWRKSLDSGILQNHKAWSLMGWLLMSVTWKPIKYYGLLLEPGEVIMSVKGVGVHLHMSIQEVRTAIKFLESLDIITTSSDWAGTRATRFKLKNWRKYQLLEDGKNQQIDEAEFDLEEKEKPELHQYEQQIANKLLTDSIIYKKERTTSKGNPPEESKTRPTQSPALKAPALSEEMRERFLTNFYPAWDSRSPQYRGMSAAKRDQRRKAWVAKFNQEPLLMPDFDWAANSRGEYGDVLLRALWQDLRGQELARCYDPKGPVA